MSIFRLLDLLFLEGTTSPFTSFFSFTACSFFGAGFLLPFLIPFPPWWGEGAAALNLATDSLSSSQGFPEYRLPQRAGSLEEAMRTN